MLQTRPPDDPDRPFSRGPLPPPPGPVGATPAGTSDFLLQLVALQLLDPADADSFRAERVSGLHDPSDHGVGLALVQAGLLTRFQLDNVLAGATHGLVVGNYRVREKLGCGGMGDVYLAEHRLMKRLVAIKTLPIDEDYPPEVRQRFYAEMRALADLHHPHVVTAFDAGELAPPEPSMPGLIYLVMEYLPGGDLDRHVTANGRCGVGEASELIRQAALGLQAAHDVHLVHRDLKPSNILRAAGGQVKLVDFGLVRHYLSRLTDPRALLGSVEFMAPEQSLDPSAVGKPADVYGLGATLFWLLTGEPPYPRAANIGTALRRLRDEPPRRLRELRPEAPAELEALLARLLERNPDRRPALPLSVANSLEAFLTEAPPVRPTALLFGGGSRPPRRVLVAAPEAGARRATRALLEPLGCACVEAADDRTAAAWVEAERFDVVLLDRDRLDRDGLAVCRALHERSGDANLKVLVLSGGGTPDELAETLGQGADDFVAKPYQPRQLTAKVAHAFRLKDAQDRAAALAAQLRAANAQLRQSLSAREDDVREAHRALLFAMAKMGESCDGETPGHLHRLCEYTLALAAAAAERFPAWAGQVDDRFRDHLRLCVPLHDIGKIGLPGDVLRKPAALSEPERRLVEQHAAIGDRILESLGKEHGASLEFLGAARGIVRHHHERWDGAGYPDRLSGEAIPAAARLTAVADVYDALRRARQHKAALSHAEAVEILLHRSAGQFDPSLLQALAGCHPELERIYRDIGE